MVTDEDVLLEPVRLPGAATVRPAVLVRAGDLDVQPAGGAMLHHPSGIDVGRGSGFVT